MPTIALVTASRHDGEARALRDRLAAAWPGGVPEGRIVIRHAGEPPLAETIDGCIVLHPGDVADGAMTGLIRELRSAHVPIVALGDARDPRAGQHDWHFLHYRAEPGQIAGLIAGLSARTASVRQLEESLRYAQSVHESVARLVDQFQDDQLLAASIQRQFVSQEMPRVDGVSCAAMFRPVDFLSGDIYSVTRLDEEHIGFFLGDAMGHGLPAALMALYIAGRIAQKEVTGGSYRIIPPAESMTRLNRDLASTGCSNVRFATAVCGTLNVRTREVQLAAAGHPPPVVLGLGAARLIDVGGALLGVMDDTTYDQVSLTLAPGEALVLYTDGLEDSLNPRRAGEEPDATPRTRHIDFLETVVLEVGEPDPERMFARFTQLMDSESGSMHQIDDVTLVGVRVGRPGEA